MRNIIISALCTIVIFTACSDPTPKRNHIPILKENLFKLQQAVVERNRMTIDSLLSTKILDNNQNSDSLLSFIYGENDLFAFTRFGNAEIVYTNNRAWVDCFVMDSTFQTTRPLTINYIFEHDMWLVSSFKIDKEKTDSL